MKIESCSECDECNFSWYYNKWYCGEGSDEMILDNDIFMSVHDNCPLRKEHGV